MVNPGVSRSTTKLANRAVALVGRLEAREQRHAEGHVRPCVGDEGLPAVQQPPTVPPFGAGADPVCVGACVRLGEPERAERASLGERSQPPLALPVAAEQEQRQGPDGHVRLPRGGQRLVRQPDLLHGRDETDRRHADPAPLLGNEDAEETELAHLAEQIGRTALLFPRPRRAGCDLPLCEVTAESGEVALGLGEREVHGAYEAGPATPGERCAMKAADHPVRSAGR